ncbi:bifunctional glycosyltransferase family 2/GtrA family protein [Patescibacteria group bacterium]|nr:bifunctional glycosyltransferase family 2/GtrA family protein [Patescibacteria group bacterium]
MNNQNQKIYLSVIIPAYNEEKRLPKTLREINNYLKKQTYTSEIIVVSDGSNDKTVEVSRSMKPEINNLKVLEFKERLGKGFGVKEGIFEAKGEYRVFTDADNSTSIDQVEKMWPEFEAGHDIVIGSRDMKESVLAVPQPWIRKIVLGGGFKLVRKIIIGLWTIKDTQCGFKGFKQKAAEDIFSRITIRHFGFDPEVLVIAKKLGYKIKEIPITWANDAQSKVKFKSMVKMLFETLKIRQNLILRKYEKKGKKTEPAAWRKTDLISALIIGEMVAWLTFTILKTLEFDTVIYQTMIDILGWKIHLGLLLAVIVPIAAAICLYITSLLGKKVPVVFQAGKFVTVGISNTLIDWGVLNLQILLTGITAGLFYPVFKGVSFLIAIINSFLWNKFWTFKKGETEKAGTEFLQFLIVSGIGLGINVGIASLAVNVIGPQAGISPKIWATVGALIATMFSMVWNFLGYKFIVFKK